MSLVSRFLAAALWIGVVAGTQADDSTLEWKAAAAAVVITPEKPMWMAGYAARDKPSEGKVHELYAKVLVLEDAAGTKVAIVTTDLIGIKPHLRDPVLAAVQQQFGLPAECVLMNASHTHCGPELREDVTLVREIGAEHAALARQYTQELAQKLIALIGEALGRLEPARLQYSFGRCGFAMNRRLPTDSGVQNSPNPDGPVDHVVPVLQVFGSNEKLKAVLFGYACHNTTLGFYQFCGDYAGFAQAYLEESHPGTTALFLTGCGADQNPYPRGTLERAQHHGRSLAVAVEAALETRRQRTIHGPLKSDLADVTLEFAPPPTRAELTERLNSSNKYVRRHAELLLEQLEQAGTIRTEYDFPLQVLQFGNDLTLAAICGETVVDYAHRLRRELSNSPESYRTDSEPIVWVSGYNNHVFGYLPSRRVLEEGGYEGGGAMTYTRFPGPLASSVEERVVGKVHELVRQVRRP